MFVGSLDWIKVCKASSKVCINNTLNALFNIYIGKDKLRGLGVLVVEQFEKVPSLAAFVCAVCMCVSAGLPPRP